MYKTEISVTSEEFLYKYCRVLGNILLFFLCVPTPNLTRTPQFTFYVVRFNDVRWTEITKRALT